MQMTSRKVLPFECLVVCPSRSRAKVAVAKLQKQQCRHLLSNRSSSSRAHRQCLTFLYFTCLPISSSLPFWCELVRGSKTDLTKGKGTDSAAADRRPSSYSLEVATIYCFAILVRHWLGLCLLLLFFCLSWAIHGKCVLYAICLCLPQALLLKNCSRSLRRRRKSAATKKNSTTITIFRGTYIDANWSISDLGKFIILFSLAHVEVK